MRGNWKRGWVLNHHPRPGLLKSLRGWWFNNQAILDEVWGDDYRSSNGLVKAHVQRLRKKLRDNLDDPRLIVTERGRGYRFSGVE